MSVSHSCCGSLFYYFHFCFIYITFNLLNFLLLSQHGSLYTIILVDVDDVLCVFWIPSPPKTGLCSVEHNLMA